MKKEYEPDQLYIIDDNVEAMRLIVDEGFLDQLVPRPGDQFAAHCYESKHHWCCAAYHCGHRDKKDNGYSVAMLPKSKHTKQKAAEVFADCIHATVTGITCEYMARSNKESN